EHKQDQGEPGEHDETENGSRAFLRRKLENDLHADQFGKRVSQHLSKNQGDLVVERKVPARHVRKEGYRERLAEGVHGKVRGKSREPGEGSGQYRIRSLQGLMECSGYAWFIAGWCL